MNKDFEVNFDGMDEILKALSVLPADMQAKILTTVLSKAASVTVIKPLRDTLNYSAEEEKNIKLIKDPKNKLMVTAGVSRGGYKLNWADRGTKERTTKKGASRGKIEGKKQIQPFLQNSVEPTLDYIENNTAEEINKFLKRYLKKLTK